MTQEHPITPPPELVEKWIESTRANDCIGAYPQNYEHLVATQAARWGADQELEACCEYLTRCAAWEPEDVKEFCDLRRPKPPSLKEQALSALYAITSGADDTREFYQDIETVKKALKSLPE